MSVERNNKSRTATVELKEGELDSVHGGRSFNGIGNSLFPAGNGGLDLSAQKLKFIDHDLDLHEG